MMNAEAVQEIMDVIRSHYKSLQSPDFSFVRDTLAQRPYEKVLRQLSTHFHLNALSTPPGRLPQPHPPDGTPWQRGYLSARARYTFSAVIGRSLMRTPTASATALAIAGATGPMGFSPMPLEW